MKCDTCLKSRPIVSENGIHHICCLSEKAAMECLTGKKKRFVGVSFLFADIDTIIDGVGGDTDG